MQLLHLETQSLETKQFCSCSPISLEQDDSSKNENDTFRRRMESIFVEIIGIAFAVTTLLFHLIVFVLQRLVFPAPSFLPLANELIQRTNGTSAQRERESERRRIFSNFKLILK